MQTRLFLILTCICVSHMVYSQTDSLQLKENVRSKVFINLQLGIATEESDNETHIFRPTTNLVLGYRLSQYFQPGIGVGYDEHKYFKSMPISMWVQGELTKKDYTPFYYFQAGRASYWINDSQIFSDVHGGRYFEVGLGYSWKLEKTKLKVSTGWRKQIFTSYENQPYYWWDLGFINSFAPYPYNGNKTTWNLEKVVFKLSLEF